MNRKGVAILSLAAIGFLVAIVLFYSQVDKLPGNQKSYLGEAEVGLFNTYIAAEKELLYIDLMAEYALQDSYEQLELYSSKEVLEKFQDNFQTRLFNFNEIYHRDLMLEDYQFTLDDKSIKGISSKELNITSDNIDYKFKPNFRISL
ncbi:MAG: hypothetical protein KKA65_04050 [Nanoarchaeota archaeon]|nr:hypothetical protein [Nanoarchaeota archaeon]MBU4242129.1 hypothetical protein [Nanoarchaeota archaeon]MBU4352247.1 hypothetical protein [Nanoarchaeota archaeon]MBU4456650.1 hypothetical protein [Nanoarchaeota archaeon]MCG2719686.1 hypothetical protein [Nanoarchaeota archaeon]